MTDERRVTLVIHMAGGHQHRLQACLVSNAQAIVDAIRSAWRGHGGDPAVQLFGSRRDVINAHQVAWIALPEGVT
jgi:hypothetical protein